MKNLVKTFLFVNLFVGAFDAFAYVNNNLVSRDYDKLNDLCNKYLVLQELKKMINSYNLLINLIQMRYYIY